MTVAVPYDQTGKYPLPIFGLGEAQNVAFNASGGASASSTPMPAGTHGVILSSVDADVRVAIGKNPVATATSTLIPKPFLVVLGIGPGDKVAVLSNSAATGNLSVTAVAAVPSPAFSGT